MAKENAPPLGASQRTDCGPSVQSVLGSITGIAYCAAGVAARASSMHPGGLSGHCDACELRVLSRGYTGGKQDNMGELMNRGSDALQQVKLC